MGLLQLDEWCNEKMKTNAFPVRIAIIEMIKRGKMGRSRILRFKLINFHEIQTKIYSQVQNQFKNKCGTGPVSLQVKPLPTRAASNMDISSGPGFPTFMPAPCYCT